jgi:hypothetical protein
MDGGLFALLLVGFSLIFFIIQRTEPKKRRLVIVVALVALELLRRFIVYRDINTEGILAFVIAIVLNFLFWAIIGRYNPVKSSDETIKVYGLDD